MNRAALSEHMQTCGLTAPYHLPLSTDAADATTLQWKTTIVTMLVETFNEQKDRTGQPTRCAMTTHTPLVPIRVERPAWPSVAEAELARTLRIGSLWDAMGDGTPANGPANGTAGGHANDPADSSVSNPDQDDDPVGGSGSDTNRNGQQDEDQSVPRPPWDPRDEPPPF